MANATLLTLAMRLARRLPLSTEPSLVFGSTDPGVRQIQEIFQEHGDELTNRHNWSQLIVPWTITLTADSVGVGSTFPSDYLKLNEPADFYRSASRYTPMSGPIPARQWQYLTNIAGTWPGYWRLYKGKFYVLGITAGSETITGEYVSKNWIIDTDGSTTKAEWTADSDTTIYPDELMLMGARWRWKQSKGLEYGEDMETFERMLEQAIANDRGSKPIPLSRAIQTDLPVNTWPGTIIPS